jgi:hypothetical protein
MYGIRSFTQCQEPANLIKTCTSITLSTIYKKCLTANSLRFILLTTGGEIVLDSTGSHETLQVTCVFCPLGIPVETYIPKQGHCGEDLPPSGPYIGCMFASRKDHLEGRLLLGRLYKLIPRDSKSMMAQGVRLHTSPDPYAYGGFELPKLGFGNGLTFWVCEHCHKLVPDPEKVQSALNEKHVLHRDLHVHTQST